MANIQWESTSRPGALPVPDPLGEAVSAFRAARAQKLQQEHMKREEERAQQAHAAQMQSHAEATRHNQIEERRQFQDAIAKAQTPQQKEQIARAFGYLQDDPQQPSGPGMPPQMAAAQPQQAPAPPANAGVVQPPGTPWEQPQGPTGQPQGADPFADYTAGPQMYGPPQEPVPTPSPGPSAPAQVMTPAMAAASHQRTLRYPGGQPFQVDFEAETNQQREAALRTATGAASASAGPTPGFIDLSQVDKAMRAFAQSLPPGLPEAKIMELLHQRRQELVASMTEARKQEEENARARMHADAEIKKGAAMGGDKDIAHQEAQQRIAQGNFEHFLNTQKVRDIQDRIGEGFTTFQNLTDPGASPGTAEVSAIGMLAKAAQGGVGVVSENDIRRQLKGFSGDFGQNLENFIATQFGGRLPPETHAKIAQWVKLQVARDVARLDHVHESAQRSYGGQPTWPQMEANFDVQGDRSSLGVKGYKSPGATAPPVRLTPGGTKPAPVPQSKKISFDEL